MCELFNVRDLNILDDSVWVIQLLQMRKMYANANMFLRKFSKCSVNVKCYLFKKYCSNLYCAPMWFDCTKTALKKLKVAYNNSLRRFMGLPWHNSASEMFVNLDINHLVNYLKFLYTDFVQGLLYYI